MAIPLTEIGCNVIALEPASGMVDELRAKAGTMKLQVVSGAGAQLPFPPGRFDVVVVARLLYLATDWHGILREAERVLTPSGRLLYEWGNGEAEEEWVQIREKARTLFEQAGVESPFHAGARSENEVDDWLKRLGFARQADTTMGPGPSITLAEFLRRLVDGEFSYIWNVPKDVQAECLPLLRSWSARTFDLERSIAMPREVRWSVYRKNAV